MAQLTGYPIKTTNRRSPISQAQRLEVLAEVGLFHGLSKRNLSMIDRLSFVRSILPGEDLIKQGDSGDDALVVLSGRALVSRNKRKLTEITPGQVCGEMALLDHHERSATVTALEPMEVLVIHGPEFRKLLCKVPKLTEAVLATLSMRLREAHAKSDL
jgi:CRP-like cAMP-binding protein